MTTIIDLAERRGQAAIAAIKRAYPGGDPQFAGMPFTSPETCKYGWPNSYWTVDETATYQDGEEFARLALKTIYSAAGGHRFDATLPRLAFARTIEAIIMQQVALRVKGGKNSRSMTSAAEGFLAEISEFIGAVMARTGGAVS